MIAAPRMRASRKFDRKGIRKDLRQGSTRRFALRVQPPLQKYSCSLLTQITSTSLAVLSHTKGRLEIVTDAGQDAVDAGSALTNALSCGRRSRVVLTPRRWRQVGERNFTGDGGKQARSPGRARNKPLKPSRAGMPGNPGATVVTNACVLLPYTRGCGCNGHPAFPDTLGSGGRLTQNSGAMRRGNEKVYRSSLRAQRSNPFFLCVARWIASLRSQ